MSECPRFVGHDVGLGRGRVRSWNFTQVAVDLGLGGSHVRCPVTGITLQCTAKRGRTTKTKHVTPSKPLASPSQTITSTISP